MSVNWERLSSVEHTLEGYAGWGVASLSAELCWSVGQCIRRSPSQRNEAHCDVIGDKPNKVQRTLRDGAVYMRAPDGGI
jgi:hypothetical protein